MYNFMCSARLALPGWAAIAAQAQRRGEPLNSELPAWCLCMYRPVSLTSTLLRIIICHAAHLALYPDYLFA